MNMMQKHKLLDIFQLALSIGRALYSIFSLDLGEMPSLENWMMPGDGPDSSTGGASLSGSSSSAPQSEPGENQEAQNPEPDLPLLDDDTRRDELNARAGYHFAGLSEESKEQILEAQLSIDRAIEKALLSNGYSRDELNQLTKRHEIRGFLFYPRGKLLSLRKYKQWVREIEFGTLRSEPYNEIMKAIRSSKLFLTNVKPIKRWELNKNQWR